MIANDDRVFLKEGMNTVTLSLDPPTLTIREGVECDGIYKLIDLYCDNKKCDCEIGVLIASRQKNEEIVIKVGWQSPSYYMNHGFSSRDVRFLRYGLLDPQVNQPAYAQWFMKYFRQLMGKDQSLTKYMRLRYHYTKIYESH
ncbi:MAG TPA: hypothetical protein DCP55_01260 [Chitinophagaceae bacterium]|nr:hypothetical protein [Chitinophagaceae bacterium]